MADIEKFLSRLNKVKSRGKDSWLSCCPAHEDQSPSLSIKHDEEGRILVNCFAGCTAEEVMTSVGLGLPDMFPEKSYIPRKYYSKKHLDEIEMQACFLGVCYSDISAGKRVDSSSLSKAHRCLKSLKSEYKELKNQGYGDICKKISGAFNLAKGVSH